MQTHTMLAFTHIGVSMNAVTLGFRMFLVHCRSRFGHLQAELCLHQEDIHLSSPLRETLEESNGHHRRAIRDGSICKSVIQGASGVPRISIRVSASVCEPGRRDERFPRLASMRHISIFQGTRRNQGIQISWMRGPRSWNGTFEARILRGAFRA